MYEFMLSNSIYLVLLILLLGFGGILFYLLRMHRQLIRLEQK